ncbi:hypothetical protein [Pseudomonas phage Haboob]
MNKATHQHLAMVAALRVAVCRCPSQKEKARKDCLMHLRASLRSVAAERV